MRCSPFYLFFSVLRSSPFKVFQILSFCFHIKTKYPNAFICYTSTNSAFSPLSFEQKQRLVEGKRSRHSFLSSFSRFILFPIGLFSVMYFPSLSIVFLYNFGLQKERKDQNLHVFFVGERPFYCLLRERRKFIS